MEIERPSGDEGCESAFSKESRRGPNRWLSTNTLTEFPHWIQRSSTGQVLLLASRSISSTDDRNR